MPQVEYEKLSKNSPIIQNLLLKKKLLRRNDPRHKKIRPVLLILGGCMQGVYGAGTVTALHKLGLGDVFDGVIGVSTGAAIAAYFLAGFKQAILGTSIYYNECLSRAFIDFRRVKKIADIDYIESILRTGKKALNVENIQSVRSDFYVATTSQRTGKGELIDVKKAKPDEIAALKASMAMIFFYRKSVRVNGNYHLDGAIGSPFPIKKVVQKFNPTDILVISNGSIHEPLLRILGEEVLGRLSLYHRKKIVEAVHRHHGLLKQEVRYFENLSGVNKGIIIPKNPEVNLLTSERRLLRKAVISSAQKTFEIFGKRPRAISFL